MNPEQKSKYTSWETPEPTYWTKHDYVVVRADERGLGQSPGQINLLSEETARSFEKVIEWAGTQPWSSGKVGTIGKPTCNYRSKFTPS
jgi:predicted acyl esterase